jgi:hypothetical protein
MLSNAQKSVATPTPLQPLFGWLSKAEIPKHQCFDDLAFEVSNSQSLAMVV